MRLKLMQTVLINTVAYLHNKAILMYLKVTVLVQPISDSKVERGCRCGNELTIQMSVRLDMRLILISAHALRFYQGPGFGWNVTLTCIKLQQAIRRIQN